jgi:hypothetical protein
MNWNAFWSGLLGTTLPGLAVSLLVLYLSGRLNRAMERHKKDIQQDIIKFSKWHEKRLDALIAIYNAFCDFLRFLRSALYVENSRMNLDPMYTFQNVIERQIVYLDDATAQKVQRYQGELLLFWNWAIESLSKEGEAARKKIQERLDTEIPAYLPWLRQNINDVVDPEYRINARNEGQPRAMKAI